MIAGMLVVFVSLPLLLTGFEISLFGSEGRFDDSYQSIGILLLPVGVVLMFLPIVLGKRK